MTDVPPSSADRSAMLLQKLGGQLNPSREAESRIRSKIHKRMAAVHLLREAREQTVPDHTALSRVWGRVTIRMGALSTRSFWTSLRDLFSPASDIRDLVWQRVRLRLQPAYARQPGGRGLLVAGSLKWVASFAVFLLLLRWSSALFAPATIAESSVNVLPRGRVTILSQGLWQPVAGETILRSRTSLQSDEGEATVILYDDLVLRMAPHTRLVLNDFADRPKLSHAYPTIILETGKIWVLGLVPRHLEGITIGTAQGQVIVHEGSVSVDAAESVDVRVWNRSAIVSRRGKQVRLVAGNALRIAKGTADLAVGRIDAALYQDSWISSNLSRDAVHQKEIAQMQRERRAAQAGILPDSQLYPAKRLAEAVDVFFAFGTEAKARKKISQANTRLNEAAALITRGSGAQATAALQEYRDTVLSVASGSGGSAAISSLLEQEIVLETTADLSAELPNTDGYALKQIVNETINALPDSIQKPDTSADEILDAISAARQEGLTDTAPAKRKLEEARELAASSSISQDLKTEVDANLSTALAAVNDTEAQEQGTVPTVSRTAPPQLPSKRPPVVLTEEQIAEKVEQIRQRIVEVYEAPVSRRNALKVELRTLQDDPYQGPLLRGLLHELPPGGLRALVGAEIRNLNEEVEKGQVKDKDVVE